MDQLIKLTIVALAVSALADTTSGFATPIRSVEYCAVVKANQINSCQQVCSEKFYYLDRYAETSDKIKGEKRLQDGSDNTCCCMYDDYWPIKNDDEWNTKLKEELEGKSHSCSAVASHIIAKEAVQLHDKVCKYLALPRPLTVYELKDFIESTDGLKALKSKSPIINSLLGLGYVNMIDSGSVNKFSAVYKQLVDRRRKWNKPDEATIEIRKLNTVRSTAEEIRKHIESPMVDRSLDDLLISYVMMNVFNANKIIDRFNKPFSKNYYGIKPEDIAENIDQADRDEFDCKQFNAFQADLKALVEISQSSLDQIVNIESVFENMSLNWRPMKMVQNTIKMYDALIGAICIN